MQRLTARVRQPLLGFTPEQVVAFWKMGDANLDGYIDRRDLDLISYAYGATKDRPNWIGACDFNGDGQIDVFDAVTCSSNNGKNIWDFFGLPKPIDPNAQLILIGVIGFFIGLATGKIF